MTQHQKAVHVIANKVDRLVIDKSTRARFTKHIDRFCKMVEDYGQALQSLERTKKRPDSWFKVMYWDTKFINVDMKVAYRPREPVNPLLWFGIFDNAGKQRNPTEKEHLMRDYVLLAAIHDGELQEPLYRPLFSDKYDGKWFRRDDFRERLWEYYLYDANAHPNITRIFGPEVSEPENERLERLNNALKNVQADIVSGEAGGGNTPVTVDKKIKTDLVNFIKSYCDLTGYSDDVKKYRDNLYRCKKITLNDAVKYKKSSGHVRQFWVHELYTNWNTYRDYVPTIPPLKPAVKLAEQFSTNKTT